MNLDKKQQAISNIYFDYKRMKSQLEGERRIIDEKIRLIDDVMINLEELLENEECKHVYEHFEYYPKTQGIAEEKTDG